MFETRLKEAESQVQSCLHRYFAGFEQNEISSAMAYASSGGKRLRAFLVMESARLHGIDATVAVPVAAAIEAMHAYSLVHDDLPAMDDDDLRRGLPTVHVKWDEATAILVGDALQASAYELLTHVDVRITDQARIELIRTMAQASGGDGMVLGQAMDIAAESATQPYGIDLVEKTQAKKTGALIEWAACAGPVMAGTDVGPLRDYATALGRAFQIADDILDVTGDEAATGKRVGKDDAAGKATFVSLLGLDRAKTRANSLVDAACAALAPYGDAADCLREAARFVISRQA